MADGTEAYVAQARTGDGSQAILKIATPESPGNTVLANEITALTLAGGRGYVSNESQMTSSDCRVQVPHKRLYGTT
ncbi:MAG: hypothetical protein J2P36_01770 [Ktedonobacteraceae bacterium]|nr:hypothetical protein [Ktedonobacteraceae bacterium]